MLQASADLIRCEQRLSIKVKWVSKVDSAAHKRDATTKHASVQVHPNKLRLPYVLLFFCYKRPSDCYYCEKAFSFNNVLLLHVCCT